MSEDSVSGDSVSGDSASGETIGRRNALKLLGGAAAVSVSAILGVREIGPETANAGAGTNNPDPAPTASPNPPANPTAAEAASSPTPAPDDVEVPDIPEDQLGALDIRDFGAEIDGVTDDTEAIHRAIDAVDPGGTVIFPPGEIKIAAMNKGTGANRLPSAAIPIDRPDDGLTIRGIGPGPFGTRLVMDGGHKLNHIGFGIPHDADSAGDEHSGLTIRDLTLSGNWSRQTPEDRFPNGFGVNIVGDSRDVVFENCIFRDWATNGGLMRAPGIRIRNCTFIHNGYGLFQDGNRGHGFNVNTTGKSGRVVAENCLFVDNTGNGVDVRGGKATIRNSVFRRHGFGLKIKHNVEETVIENCRFVDSEHHHIHCVPNGNEGTGTLRLQSVVMEDSRYPAITLNQRPGTLEGSDILIKNANTADPKEGAIYINADSPLGDRHVDIGTLSIHDMNGDAIDFSHAVGEIDRLVHSGTEGVGDSADVTIDTVENGGPINVSVPDESEVGARIVNVPPEIDI